MFPGQVIIDAHEHCTNNRKELESSHKCGCFYCKTVFKAEDVNFDDCMSVPDKDPDNPTMFCPYCGIDSLIGDASGYRISPEFLSEMYDYWFN